MCAPLLLKNNLHQTLREQIAEFARSLLSQVLEGEEMERFYHVLGTFRIGGAHEWEPFDDDFEVGKRDHDNAFDGKDIHTAEDGLYISGSADQYNCPEPLKSQPKCHTEQKLAYDLIGQVCHRHWGGHGSRQRIANYRAKRSTDESLSEPAKSIRNLTYR